MAKKCGSKRRGRKMRGGEEGAAPMPPQLTLNEIIEGCDKIISEYPDEKNSINILANAVKVLAEAKDLEGANSKISELEAAIRMANPSTPMEEETVTVTSSNAGTPNASTPNAGRMNVNETETVTETPMEGGRRRRHRTKRAKKSKKTRKAKKSKKAKRNQKKN